MKKSIREKINQALAQNASLGHTNEVPRFMPPSSTTVVYNTDILVNDVIADPANWTLNEISERHNVGYGTVYRALRGRPGWLRFGGTIRVADFLYQKWVKESIERDLPRR